MSDIITVDAARINTLIKESRENPRKRAFDIVRSADCPEHVPAVMLNAMQPGTYVQPHKHPKDGSEIWTPDPGTITAISFDEDGNIVEHHDISNIWFRGKRSIILPGDTYHTLLVREPDTVLFESYGAVFDAHTYKTPAPWAPKEVIRGKDNWTPVGQREMDSYLTRLARRVGLCRR